MSAIEALHHELKTLHSIPTNCYDHAWALARIEYIQESLINLAKKEN